MKRLMVVGGIAAVLLAAAASTHSPPAVNSVMQAPNVVALAPSFTPAAPMDLVLTNHVVLNTVVALATSLRSEQVSFETRGWRLTRHSYRNTLINVNRKRHTADTSMRGWGFL